MLGYQYNSQTINSSFSFLAVSPITHPILQQFLHPANCVTCFRCSENVHEIQLSYAQDMHLTPQRAIMELKISFCLPLPL